MSIETTGEALGPHETALRAQWATEPTLKWEDFEAQIKRHEAMADAVTKDWLLANRVKPSVGLMVSSALAALNFGMGAALIARVGYPVPADFLPSLVQCWGLFVTFLALAVWVGWQDRKFHRQKAQFAGMDRRWRCADFNVERLSDRRG